MTTTSLSSSLDVLSLNSSTTTWASDSLSDEDEIVWSLSSSALLSTSPPLQSPLSETGDFVLVPRATAAAAAAALSASPTADTIADEMAALSLTPAVRAQGSAADPVAPTAPRRAPIKRATKTRRYQTVTAIEQQQQQQPAPPAGPRKKGKKAKRARGSSSTSASSASSTAGIHAAAGAARITPSSSEVRSSAGKKSPAKKKSAGGSATGLGLGTRAVVDDSVSETSEASSSEASSSATAATDGYQEAHKYMTSYLAHPPAVGNNNNGSALLMLQALILELGCLPGVAAGKFSIPKLPTTLRQAKLLLKSHAFINVRDYLAVREQGQDALQRVMHPNRTSLVKEVRQKAKRMPVGEIKKAGLNVLLVHTHS